MSDDTTRSRSQQNNPEYACVIASSSGNKRDTRRSTSGKQMKPEILRIPRNLLKHSNAATFSDSSEQEEMTGAEKMSRIMQSFKFSAKKQFINFLQLRPIRIIRSWTRSAIVSYYEAFADEEIMERELEQAKEELTSLACSDFVSTEHFLIAELAIKEVLESDEICGLVEQYELDYIDLDRIMGLEVAQNRLNLALKIKRNPVFRLLKKVGLITGIRVRELAKKYDASESFKITPTWVDKLIRLFIVRPGLYVLTSILGHFDPRIRWIGHYFFGKGSSLDLPANLVAEGTDRELIEYHRKRGLPFMHIMTGRTYYITGGLTMCIESTPDGDVLVGEDVYDWHEDKHVELPIKGLAAKAIVKFLHMLWPLTTLYMQISYPEERLNVKDPLWIFLGGTEFVTKVRVPISELFKYWK